MCAMFDLKFHLRFHLRTDMASPLPTNRKQIEALRAPQSETYREYRDTRATGLYLRVYPSGRKVWRHRYRVRGRTRVMNIGEFPGTGLADARAVAASNTKLVRIGEDPAGEAQKAAAQRRAAPTVAEFFSEYLERHAKPNKRSWRTDEGLFRDWVKPRIGEVKLEDVRRRDVVAIVDAVADSGARRQPGKVKALLSKVFNFAIERGVIEVSPVQKIPTPQPESHRPALSADEIRAWWQATEADAMPDSPRLALRLLLLTGQRPGEVFAIETSELSLERGEWHLPGERRKRGRAGHPHVVPLSDTALSVVQAALESCSQDGWLFPKPAGDGPQRVDGQPNLRIKQALPRVQLHDARRTVATEVAEELEFTDEAVARVLGHYSQSVTAGYIKRTTKIAQRALAAWDRRLAQIVSGEPVSTVVAFPTQGPIHGQD